MSLDVKIFWVEDDAGWLALAEARLKRTFMEKWALGLRPDTFSTFDAASAKIRSGLQDYDLALIDYRLGGSDAETGATLVEQLRNPTPDAGSGIYTEVIFYSGDTDKAERDLVHEKGLGLSGVFLVGRGESTEEFEDECLPRMGAILKKVLDLTRNRGIVAAVASDIDAELTRRIGVHPDFVRKIAAGDVASLARKMHGKRGKSVEESIARKGGAMEMLKSHDIATWAVRIELAKNLLEGDKLEKFKRFERAVQPVSQCRNALVHHAAPGYSDEQLLEIRRKIVECQRLLEEALPDPVTPE